MFRFWSVVLGLERCSLCPQMPCGVCRGLLTVRSIRGSLWPLFVPTGNCTSRRLITSHAAVTEHRRKQVFGTGHHTVRVRPGRKRGKRLDRGEFFCPHPGDKRQQQLVGGSCVFLDAKARFVISSWQNMGSQLTAIPDKARRGSDPVRHGRIQSMEVARANAGGCHHAAAGMQ